MSDKNKFETWMTSEQWFHGSDFEWDEKRNCYSQFGIHLAYKAWLASSESMRDEIRAANINESDARCHVAELESKLAQMAAENAGLKETMSAIAGCWFKHISGDDYEWQIPKQTPQEAVAQVLSETPATDAFLAEVRAQESKRVYESIMDNPSVTDMESLVDWLEQNANDSLAYAAKLRQDANTAELVAAGIITRIEG